MCEIDGQWLHINEHYEDIRLMCMIWQSHNPAPIKRTFFISELVEKKESWGVWWHNVTIKCCNFLFPWMGFHWACWSHESDNPLRYDVLCTFGCRQYTVTHGSVWAVPHIAAVQSDDAAAAILPETCSFCCLCNLDPIKKN